MRVAISSICWTLEEVSLEIGALKRSSSEWPMPSTPVWTLSSAHSQDSLSSLSQVIKILESIKEPNFCKSELNYLLV